MQPKPRAGTLMPLAPRVRYFMAGREFYRQSPSCATPWAVTENTEVPQLGRIFLGRVDILAALTGKSPDNTYIPSRRRSLSAWLL